MSNIKLDEDTKNNIVNLINQNKEKIFEYADDCISFSALQDTDVDFLQLFEQNFNEGFNKLKEENILTFDFINTINRHVDIDIIELTKSDKNLILENYKYLLEDDMFEHLSKKDDVYLSDLIYVINTHIRNTPINLQPDVAEVLLIDNRVHSNGNEFETILNDSSINLNTMYRYVEEPKIISELTQLCRFGIITVEQLSNFCGTMKFNPTLEQRSQEYLKEKRAKLERGIQGIKGYEDLEHMNISDINKEKLVSLIDKINSIDDISKLDIDVLESYINEFNEISNDEWKQYLDKNPDNILVHMTPSPIKGDFIENEISTSLITANKNKTYEDMKYGYIIKPKNISVAVPEDSYVLNARTDKYSRHFHVLSHLPQKVESEMNESEISEIDLDDFEIVSVFTKSLPQSEKELQKLQEYSDAQGGIPIKIRGIDGKIKTMEAYKTELEESKKQNTQNIENSEIISDNKEILEEETNKSYPQKNELSNQRSNTNLWMKRFSNFYTAIDRVSEKSKFKFIQMKKEITQEIKNILKERNNLRQKSNSTNIER